ncbi:protein lplC domain protein [Streptococcus pneumoniae 2070768]|nr:protein lplC domain protein [Streptococcus pneumoniae 2070768]
MIALSCILPFVFVIIISVTDEKSLLQYGYSFFPSQFGLDGFEFLAQFKDKILQALFISVFVTVVGTLTNVFITTTYAYAISRTTFKYRRFFYHLRPSQYVVQRWFGTRLYHGDPCTSAW